MELKQRFGNDAVKSRGACEFQTTVDLDMQQMAEEGGQTPPRQTCGGVADQLALVAIDPRTHFVKAMVGGVDYSESQFNRGQFMPADSRGQPSKNRWCIYAAFATGRFTPASSVADTPVSYPDGYRLYSPRNYDGSFMGNIPIRTAPGAISQRTSGKTGPGGRH